MTLDMKMRLAGTVLYVGSVQPVLEFYRSAFGVGTRFVDLDFHLPKGNPDAANEFAMLDVSKGELHIASHALGELLMPGYERPESGQPTGVEIVFFVDDVESAFERAVSAGALPLAEPQLAPWGQMVSYVRSLEGTCVGL